MAKIGTNEKTKIARKITKLVTVNNLVFFITIGVLLFFLVLADFFYCFFSWNSLFFIVYLDPSKRSIY
ncbi:hypothetical protein CPX_001480 [Candidatus Phytoplasma pruni]|uniref:Uncharacterized protein n=1 Tax=Candidatus Phytoplasma pruni TaxID=479893 RepID=A0A0M1N037_9MOLU|nr:hypothetical protein [Candidatus Phytoplasma pruni]KOR75521.1 hypothetical protein CPX_001480 [Candidatus Phytoplasma pruni]